MTNKNHYKDSWKLYKTHSDFFDYDFEFYERFCKDKKTLEAFAGYGRLTNHLQSKGIDIFANELSEELASYISIPKHKLDIGDFLTYNSNENFERIIIAYNSFCLITEEHKTKELFSKIESLMSKDGLVSLSYYHPNFWHDETEYSFVHDGETVNYHSDYELKFRDKKLGTWKDIYNYRNQTHVHEYNLRIYEDSNDLLKAISHTNLKIIKEIRNYDNPQISGEGWTEYILRSY